MFVGVWITQQQACISAWQLLSSGNLGHPAKSVSRDQVSLDTILLRNSQCEPLILALWEGILRCRFPFLTEPQYNTGGMIQLK